MVNNYNSTPHASHGFAPNNITSENKDEVYKILYPLESIKADCRLKKGDRVRTMLPKSIFEKGYTKNWSTQIFIIADIRQSNNVCWYYLKTLDNTPVEGIWYYYQLNLVASNVD